MVVRLINTKMVGCKSIARLVFAKPKAVLWAFVDDGQEALFTHTVGAIKDRGEIYFAIFTEIEGDTSAT